MSQARKILESALKREQGYRAEALEDRRRAADLSFQAGKHLAAADGAIAELTEAIDLLARHSPAPQEPYPLSKALRLPAGTPLSDYKIVEGSPLESIGPTK